MAVRLSVASASSDSQHSRSNPKNLFELVHYLLSRGAGRCHFFVPRYRREQNKKKKQIFLNKFKNNYIIFGTKDI